MDVTIRPATSNDAALLVRIIDIASEGLIPAIWSAMAPEGMDGSDIGLAIVAAEEGEFSHRFGVVAEAKGHAVGGMISYCLPDPPEPVGADVPEVFSGIKELENLAPGQWYINVIAVLPEHRGNGFGTALLSAAEGMARDTGCPGLALIVAATNENALGVYRLFGFREVERRPFNLTDFGVDPTEALLLSKDVRPE